MTDTVTPLRAVLAAAAAALLAGCQPGADSAASGGDATIPDAASTVAFDGIWPDETLRFTGTEPFWGGSVSGTMLTYSTPEDPEGTAIAVERFEGRGGLAYSGSLDGADFEMAVTPLECSDGMSDRTYPFTITLQIGAEQRNGCGWTERRPFEGPEQP